MLLNDNLYTVMLRPFLRNRLLIGSENSRRQCDRPYTPTPHGVGRSIRVTDCSVVAKIPGANAVAPTKLFSPAPPAPPAPLPPRSSAPLLPTWTMDAKFAGDPHLWYMVAASLGCCGFCCYPRRGNLGDDRWWGC